MTPTRKRRLIGVLVIIFGVSVAAIVAMKALNENMLFFVSPTDVDEQNLPAGKRFQRLLEEHFDPVVRSRVTWMNLPPAFVYRCRR